QNRDNLAVYRQAGLEFVDLMRAPEQEHATLNRQLAALRQRALEHHAHEDGVSIAAANARLAAFDNFAAAFSDAAEPLRGFIADLVDFASETKTRYLV